MESITHFLDPKSIPDVTGDELDVDKALDKKSDLDADSDTIEINITNNVEKEKSSTSKSEKSDKKISDVVLPGKKESDEESSESEKSSDDAETSGESEKAETSDDTKKEETKSDEPKSEEEPKKEETKSEESNESDAGTAETESVKEDDAEEDAVDVESDEVSVETNIETTVAANDESDEESTDADEPNSDVDHGESDLDVDTQQPAPLLKLVKEYDFYSTKIYEIPNGAQIVYINKPSDLCYCSFDFKVGSYYEDDSNRGISHLLEHLMFNGCPGISALEFNAKLDKLGMSVNAFTSRMLTSYHFTGLKANFIPAFDLYTNLLNSFTPTQEIVDKEKGVVINEIGVYNDDNWSCLHEAVNSQAYRQHPITHPILGYEDVIRNITVDQVKTWYETNYNSKNLTLYVVGDFPEEDLVFIAGKLQLVRDGNKNADPVITDAMALPFYKNVITHKEGVVQTLIDSELPFKNEGFNLFEIKILAEILGGTMSSYLWNEFREERSIAYQVGAYTSDMDPVHLNIHLYAGLNNADDAETAKSIFKDAFTYAKAISEDEFNKGLNIMLSSLLNIEETESGLLSLVRDIIYYGFELDAYISTIEHLTYDSYQSFAEIIDPSLMVTGILYPMV